MPAIPVYARLEMHLTDEELRTLSAQALELIEEHCRADSPCITQLYVASSLYAAAQRTMRERNMPA